jgi:membrane protease YdiL (CAAX protease family)
VHASVGRVVLALLAVTVTVVVEELVFRGLLQTTLQRTAGRVGFTAATALFAFGYLGSGSAALVLTFALAGVLFAYGFARTRDLPTVIAAHWELALGAFVVWPGLFGRSVPTWVDGPVTTALLALAVAGVVVAAVREPLPAVR